MSKNSSFRVHNDLSQAERRQVLRDTLQGRRTEKATYFSHAHSDAAGRFAALDQPPRHVIGSTPVPQYPTLPRSAWSNQTAAIPPEEPLGFSVEDVPAVGEAHEISKLRNSGSGADVIVHKGDGPTRTITNVHHADTQIVPRAFSFRATVFDPFAVNIAKLPELLRKT